MKIPSFIHLSHYSTAVLRASTTFSRTIRMVSSSHHQESSYVPPTVWTYREEEGDGGNKFGSVNRPTAGPRFEREMPRGKHPFQLYSLATPNGVKVTIMFEELLQAGYTQAEYDAWLIKIMDLDQFSSGFVDVNPNSKIPAMMDYTSSSSSDDGNEKATRVFESGSILLYLAEKFDNAFLPKESRTEVLNWLFWQMGSAPFLGGGFGHFFAYANEKMPYPIDRFTMEVKRQLDVLNRQLEHNRYIAGGDEYTIADIAIFPWYGTLVLDESYENAATFLNVQEEYPHVIRWAKEVAARPAVMRGRIVNKTWGDGPRVAERHSSKDIDDALSPQSKSQ